MTQFLGFGDGSDGAVTLSGTHAPIDSACTGTAAATSLTATNASFAAGQIILIHQTVGTGFGNWEINRISSYVAGTITTVYPLANTYSSGAQVMVMKQYTTVSGSLTAKAWNGTVGGIMAFLSNSDVTIDGTVTGSSKGFTGGATTNTSGSTGYAGAGPSSDSHPQQRTVNGTAGGGGGINLTPDASGGGGGNVTGGATGGGAGGGDAGAATSASNLTTANLGGGGGGSWADPSNGSGGTGGCFIVIMAKEKITVTGSLPNNGGNGGATGSEETGCGAGAGGCTFLKSKVVILGSNLVTATGGVGGIGTQNSGGVGGQGGIRVEACSATGTTNPTYSDGVGGYSFCAGNSAIL